MAMKKLSFCFFGIVLCLRGSFHVFAQEQAEPPVYKGGGSWIYRAIDKPIGSSTTRVLNGDFEITFQEERRKVFRLEAGQKVEEDNPGPLVFMLPTKAIIESETQFFQFPLMIGKKWPAKYYSKPLSRWINAENSVTRIETVTTPAGSFPAFKIERQFYYQTGGQYIGFTKWYQTFVYFYRPKTRRIVKFQVKGEVPRGGMGDVALDRTTDIELIKLGAENPN